mmetsp:Transcript_24130/g.48784  ORF Transcript_24130/g.48784 Transcript_24130/m.48784 type:complete len:215 (+) Transcript_24130:257-901(+)
MSSTTPLYALRQKQLMRLEARKHLYCLPGRVATLTGHPTLRSYEALVGGAKPAVDAPLLGADFCAGNTWATRTGDWGAFGRLPPPGAWWLRGVDTECARNGPDISQGCSDRSVRECFVVLRSGRWRAHYGGGSTPTCLGSIFVSRGRTELFHWLPVPKRITFETLTIWLTCLAWYIVVPKEVLKFEYIVFMMRHSIVCVSRLGPVDVQPVGVLR